MRARAVRFEIEYADGTVSRLEGADAEQHLRWLDSMCSLGAMHGFASRPKVRWATTKRAKEA